MWPRLRVLRCDLPATPPSVEDWELPATPSVEESVEESVEDWLGPDGILRCCSPLPGQTHSDQCYLGADMTKKPLILRDRTVSTCMLSTVCLSAWLLFHA